MTKTHLIPDESLGGVLREYVEVDRKTQVDDYVIFENDQVAKDAPENDSVINIEKEAFISTANTFGATLEPTDIIHVDGKRYRMVGRKANVGEKVLDLYDQKRPIKTIISVPYNSDTAWYSFETENGQDMAPLRQNEYRVLEPIDQQQNEDNHSQRKIEQLENELFSIKKDFETWAQEFENFKNKLKQYNNILKIAVCGNFRAGKDTVADYLVEKYFFKKFAFADELKDTLHRLFPDIPRVPKPRHPYQVFGEGMCDLDIPGAKTVWIDACLRSIDNYIKQCTELHKECKNIVITDLRKPLEYERLRKENYFIIRVTASEEIRLQRAKEAGDKFNKADLSHNTESYVDQFDVDYEIENNGTLEELKRKADEVMLKILKNGR